MLPTYLYLSLRGVGFDASLMFVCMIIEIW